MLQANRGGMGHLAVTVILLLSITIPLLSSGRACAGDNAATKEAKCERPAFDLTYLSSDAMGVLALRPHAIFGVPAMKPLAGMANKGLERLRQFLNLSADPKLCVEDIEQIIGDVTINPGDKKHGRDFSVFANVTMIRTTRDFDWMKLMRKLDPKLEEVCQEGRVYYRCHYPISIALTSPNATFCFCIPDKRSIAFLKGKALPAFPKDRSVQQPHFSWEKDWKLVEHGLMALVMDTRSANGLSKEDIGDFFDLVFLFQNSASVVAGVDWKDDLDIHAYLTGKDRAASTRIRKEIKTLMAQWQSGLEPAPKDAPEAERKATAFYVQMYRTLLNQARTQLQGTTVCVQTNAKINLADFAKFFFFECSCSKK